MPGNACSIRSLSAGLASKVRSIADAATAIVRIALTRWGVTPTRRNFQSGICRQTFGAGTARIAGGAGPGATSPNSASNRRHAWRASMPVTFCSITAPTHASNARQVRGTRQSRWRRHARAISG